MTGVQTCALPISITYTLSTKIAVTALTVPVFTFIVTYLEAAMSSTFEVMNSVALMDTAEKSSFWVPLPASAEESSIISKSVSVVALPCTITTTSAVFVV